MSDLLKHKPMKKRVLYSLLLVSSAIHAIGAFAAAAPVETSNQNLADHKITQPGVAIETSPLTFLREGYNFGLQIPLSSRFTVGPKVTLFRYSEDRYSKTGSQIGVRAHYYFQNDWRSTGIFLKGGFFRDNYTENGSIHLYRDGYAKGLMADLLFGFQVRGSDIFGFSASLGFESSNWKNIPDTIGYFPKREGRHLSPVVELNVSVAL